MNGCTGIYLTKWESGGETRWKAVNVRPSKHILLYFCSLLNMETMDQQEREEDSKQ